MSGAEFAVSAGEAAGRLGRKDPERGVADLEAVADVATNLCRAGPDCTASGIALLLNLERDARGAIECTSSCLLDGGTYEQWWRLAVAACDISDAFVDAYTECRGACDAALAAAGLRRVDVEVRLARAAGDRILWERAARKSPHPRLWERLNAVFAGTVASRDPLVEPLGRAGEEYLRAVALYAAGLDQLNTDLLPVVDGLVRFALAAMQLRQGGAAGALYVVDPASAEAPRRLVRPLADSAAYWFFSPVHASESLVALARQAETDSLPFDVRVAPFEREGLLVAIEHLRRHWGDAPPVRRYRRHLLEGPLSAVCGFDAFRSALNGGPAGGVVPWSLRDISRGGVGAVAPHAAAKGLKVGALVGIRAEGGGAWHLGVVRRIHGDAADGAFIGIETLSQRPTAIKVDDGRAAADVLACDPILRGEAVRIAAPLSVLRPGVPLFLSANGTLQKLKPLDGSLGGSEFELRVYQVL